MKNIISQNEIRIRRKQNLLSAGNENLLGLQFVYNKLKLFINQ